MSVAKSHLWPGETKDGHERFEAHAAVDEGIVDDDGDGTPGLTVTIEVTPEFIGELHVVRREFFAFEGSAPNPTS